MSLASVLFGLWIGYGFFRADPERNHESSFDETFRKKD